MKDEAIFKLDQLGESSIGAILKSGAALAAQSMIMGITENSEEIPVIVPNNHALEMISAELPNPKRKRGERTFTEPASFCWYVNKHASPDNTVLIADQDRGEIQAVINDHGATQAEWGDFSALLRLGFSEEWRAWTARAGHMFSQAEFADFIEDNRSDLKVGKFNDKNGNEIENLSTPELTRLIEQMQIFSEENVVSSVDRRMGDVSVEYVSKTEEKNKVKLPRALYLAISIYKGGDLWQVKLRLRIRKQGPAIQFYYLIDQEALLIRKAFDEICDLVERGKGEDADGPGFAGVSLPALRGVIENRD